MSKTSDMRALLQTSFDGPRDLRLISDAAIPVPEAHQVRLRVAAAGVNFGDIAQGRGSFLGGPTPPYVAGFEAAGEVEAVGDAVTSLEPGARVVGVGIGCGTFAEYAALPAAAVMPVPAGWSEPQALGLMVNWPTALAALKPLGRIAAGETVLIHAAAGGTGQAAVKLAKHFGAAVIAAAAPSKHEIVRELGADHVLDSHAGDMSADILKLTDGAGVDLVLEANGGPHFAASLAAAKRVTGRVIVYGTADGEASVSNWELIYRHQVQLAGLNIGMLIQANPQLFGEMMGEMFGLMAAGVITPSEPSTYALADGPRVLAELEARKTVGKLALVP